MIYLAVIAFTAAVFLAVAIVCAFKVVQISVMGESGNTLQVALTKKGVREDGKAQ